MLLNHTLRASKQAWKSLHMLMRDIVLLCCVALVFGFRVYRYKINNVTATPLRDQRLPLSYTIDKKSCPSSANKNVGEDGGKCERGKLYRQN